VDRSPAALAQELEIAYADWFRQDDAFGWADLEGCGDLALRQAGTTAWLPPRLRHLRAAGAAVLLPGVDDPYPQLPACPLRLAGLEASLQTLMFVTVRRAPAGTCSLTGLLVGMSASV